MIFDTLPNEEKLKVLLQVVRGLIVNSRSAEIFRLEEILRQNFPPQPDLISEEKRKEIIKEQVKEQIKERVKEKLEPKKEFPMKKVEFEESLLRPPERRVQMPVSSPPTNFASRRVLRMPKLTLPAHLASIQPAPTNKIAVDLGKLNPYVNDPKVKTIETEGESETVYVSGAMGRKPTGLKLSRAEIDEVIDRFSKAAKIPKKEGMFKVAVGKLLLTAMVSESVSPRFIIEKMA